jgi:hypothetical protein
MVDKRGIPKIDCNHLPGDSMKTNLLEYSTVGTSLDRNGRQGKFRYQVLNFFLELVLFILHSFLNFPAHIRRIIIFFVYSKYHQPALAYSFFKQVDLPPSHVIDVKDIHPLQTPEEDEVHKHFFNQPEPYDSLPSPDFKVDLLPSTFPSVVNN